MNDPCETCGKSHDEDVCCNCGKKYPRNKSWQRFCEKDCAKAFNAARWRTIRQSEYDELLRYKAQVLAKKKGKV